MKATSDLQHRVIYALAEDPRIDPSAIGVSIRHGVVTLNGTVVSHAEKDAADAIVHAVPGVLDVANDIEVKPTWKTNPTDPEIAEAARAALARNRVVPHERIRSTVTDGQLTLTGTVHTLAEHDEAEAAVRDLDGVRRVTNRIVVEISPVSKAALRGSIEQALGRHLGREIDRIVTEIDGDTVVLTGTIGSWSERRAVVGAVKGTPGVKRIEDRLHLVQNLRTAP
jgi:osmotically-inducible protein OsmY